MEEKDENPCHSYVRVAIIVSVQDNIIRGGGGETVTRRKSPLAKREDKQHEREVKIPENDYTKSQRNNNLKNCLILSSIARTLVSYTHTKSALLLGNFDESHSYKLKIVINIYGLILTFL